MIISKTPLRISFCGGGTDLKEYWEEYGGAVVSASIDKFTYAILKKRIDSQIWMKYSKNETVETVDEIKNGLLRETLKKTGISQGLELALMCDIPQGTGLGGSSSFAVGCLNVMYSSVGKKASPEKLAKDACEVEINRLGEPIGKQDQYIAAYGGFNLIEFKKNGNVKITPLNLDPIAEQTFFSRILLFNTGIACDAKKVLSQQQKRISEKLENLHHMKYLAYKSAEAIRNGNFSEFGEMLHENWEYKKKMADNISNPEIDHWYEEARKTGAVGGKICGAGGRGFLLFYVEPENQHKVRKALSDLVELHFRLEKRGSRIIYDE